MNARHPARLRSATRWAVTATCAALLASACGTTVPLTSSTAVDNGLGPVTTSDGGQLPTTSLPGGEAPGALVGGVQGSGPVSAGGRGGSATTGSAPTGAATLAPGPAGPAPTGPLRFGILDVGSSGAAVSSFGGKAQTTVNEQTLSRAFVKYFNVHGGIAGRKLEAVEYTQDPNSSNYQTDLAAACARFTQDNKLTVVLRAQLGAVMSENYENCLTKAGVTSIGMSYATGDNSMYARHPRLYSVSAPSVDRRMRAVLEGLTASGYLLSKNTIGLVVEDCPESQAAYKNTIAPLATSLGLKLMVRSVSCLKGFSDVGALAAQVQSAVLPFRSAGVDRVSFVSGFEVLMLLFFETNASSQGYKPSYALSSNSPIGGSPGQFSDEAESRMRGMGWAPNTDVTGPLTTATAKKCDAMARSQGINPQSQGDVALLRSVCDLFLVFKASVESVGGRSDGVSIANGLLKASTSYQSAALLGGRLKLGQGRQDAAAQVAEWGFVSSCTCIKYLRAPRAIR